MPLIISHQHDFSVPGWSSLLSAIKKGGMSQQEAALRTGLDKSTVNRKLKNPSQKDSPTTKVAMSRFSMEEMGNLPWTQADLDLYFLPQLLRERTDNKNNVVFVFKQLINDWIRLINHDLPQNTQVIRAIGTGFMCALIADSSENNDQQRSDYSSMAKEYYMLGIEKLTELKNQYPEKWYNFFMLRWNTFLIATHVNSFHPDDRIDNKKIIQDLRESLLFDITRDLYCEEYLDWQICRSLTGLASLAECADSSRFFLTMLRKIPGFENDWYSPLKDTLPVAKEGDYQFARNIAPGPYNQDPITRTL